MIKRLVEGKIEKYLKDKESKIFFLWGPRRSGKTTLLNKISKKFKVKKFNFDYLSDAQQFIATRDKLEKLVKENRVILIDEVQNYPAGTIPLKLLFDEFNVKIIATGSSELRQKAGQDFDSLAGRYTDNYCLPFSLEEVKTDLDILKYGLYPEIYLAESENKKTNLLQKILDAYVLKDVTNIYDLKNDKLAKDILTKIALQLGSEVSLRELAGSLNANVSTVSNYIEIFIKNYILIGLPSFKTNLRKAVSENKKYYFYDLGIRNILVKDFRDMTLRPDFGGLWENFVISEIEKKRRNSELNLNMYFYREYGGKEIDLVLEDYKKNYTCLEIKTQKGDLRNIFPLPAKVDYINQDNYHEKIRSLNA